MRQKDIFSKLQEDKEHIIKRLRELVKSGETTIREQVYVAGNSGAHYDFSWIGGDKVFVVYKDHDGLATASIDYYPYESGYGIELRMACIKIMEECRTSSFKNQGILDAIEMHKKYPS